MKHALVAVLALLAAACGRQPAPAASRVAAIGTDASGAGYLYWLQGDVLFRGSCRDDDYVQANCGAHLQSADYVAFKAALADGTPELETVLRRLESQIIYAVAFDRPVFEALKPEVARFDAAFNALAR